MRTLAMLFIVLVLSSQQHFAQSAGTQQPHAFRKTTARDVSGKYLLHIPRSHGRTREPLPLIMYLHGGSLRGDDLQKIKTLGLPALVEADAAFPFAVVSPLCPAGEIWTDTDLLIGILDEVISRHRIDAERVYLTGHSMGGRGTRYLAYKHPERFAAIAPMSPVSTITAWTSRLRDTPA